MSETTINVHVSDDSALATLTAGGCVTIENSGDLRLAFMDALERSTQVALDIRRLEEVDITAAQVICSACKTAAASGRYLVTEGELPECIINLGKGIGATMGLLCKQNRNEPCNWFGGAK
jgi:anti-anti-sigma regulatory factor